MEQHEARDRSVCFSMYDMPVSKSRALEASRVVATVRNSRMEVGEQYYGFCFGTTENQQRQ